MWRIAFILLLLPSIAGASNAGIVRGLWYDQEQFFVGEPVRIYVAVRNNTGADLSGTVEFFVGDKKIERNNISALDGRIVESWADWIPDYGTSTITATLSRTEISSTASGTQAIEVVSALAEDTIFVDFDTDGDGVGNHTDTDDDNDTIPDTEEVKGGTDPLDPDDPAPEPEENESSQNTSSEDNRQSAPGEGSAPSNSTSTVNRTITNEPQGLEQFLVESRADSFLTGVTDVINTTKKRVDAFRDKRDRIRNADTITIPVNEDGFGEIERIPAGERTQPVAEKPDGFFGDLITFVGTIFSAVFTVMLYALSGALAHPILMQLLLLVLILFIIIKIARRLGARPQ